MTLPDVFFHVLHVLFLFPLLYSSEEGEGNGWSFNRGRIAYVDPSLPNVGAPGLFPSPPHFWEEVPSKKKKKKTLQPPGPDFPWLDRPAAPLAFSVFSILSLYQKKMDSCVHVLFLLLNVRFLTPHKCSYRPSSVEGCASYASSISCHVSSGCDVVFDVAV